MCIAIWHISNTTIRSNLCSSIETSRAVDIDDDEKTANTHNLLSHFHAARLPLGVAKEKLSVHP